MGDLMVSIMALSDLFDLTWLKDWKFDPWDYLMELEDIYSHCMANRSLVNFVH